MGPARAETDRSRAAVALLRAHGDVLRRVARRHSLCADDADDALQRASLILLTKAPPINPGRLIAWMVVVTKHEAMAVRRGRDRREVAEVELAALRRRGWRLDRHLES